MWPQDIIDDACKGSQGLSGLSSGPCTADLARDAAVGTATQVAKAGVEQAIVDLFKAASRTMNQLMRWVMTAWMDPKLDPKLARMDGDGGWSSIAALSTLADLTKPLVALALFVAVVMAGASVAMQHRAAPLLKLGQTILTVILVSSLATIATQILINYGDSFTKDVLSRSVNYQSTGPNGSAKVADLLVVSDSLAQDAGFALTAMFTFMPLIMLSNAVQIAFMIFRGAVIPLMLVMLPLAAAFSGNEFGAQWFKKLLGWLLAFVLYKPIAALVYATGFLLRESATQEGVKANDIGTAMMQAISGAIILMLAVLVLPALLKMVAPIASAGSSSMFSAAGAIGAIAGVAATVATVGAAAPAAAGAAGGVTGAVPLASGAPSAAAAPPPTPPGGGAPTSGPSGSGGPSDPPPARHALPSGGSAGPAAQTPSPASSGGAPSSAPGTTSPAAAPPAPPSSSGQLPVSAAPLASGGGGGLAGDALNVIRDTSSTLVTGAEEIED